MTATLGEQWPTTFGLDPISFEVRVADTQRLPLPGGTRPPRPLDLDFDLVDYRTVLGLSEGADMEDVRRAFQQQVIRWHPDRVHSDEKEIATERFKVVCAAYEALRAAAALGRGNEAARAGARRNAPAVPLTRAWMIFNEFVVDACIVRFRLTSAPDIPARVVRLVRTLGVASVLSTAGPTGGVALAAVTVVLLDRDSFSAVFAGLGEAEQIEFGKAMVVIARHV